MKTKNIFSVLGVSMTLLCFLPSCEKSVYANEDEAVDMGLSVKWAQCNVGANRPSDYGHLYAWAEFEEKDIYSWETYKYGNSPDSIKSNVSALDAEFDVANRKWGGKWRMPTKQEFEELADTLHNCKWKFGTLDNVLGYWVISRINNNKIFLPLAGCKFESEDYNEGRMCSYWTNQSQGPKAYHMNIMYDEEKPKAEIELDYIFYGKSIRPVLPK